MINTKHPEEKLTNGESGRNGAGSGRTGAQVQRESVSFGRIYSLLRAHLDTLAETDRRAESVAGLDRAQALRDFAGEIDRDVPLLLEIASFAIAEAIALERGRNHKPAPPTPDETSETRRARTKEDSSPGRKRS